jgi:hypothetical protein
MGLFANKTQTYYTMPNEKTQAFPESKAVGFKYMDLSDTEKLSCRTFL